MDLAVGFVSRFRAPAAGAAIAATTMAATSAAKVRGARRLLNGILRREDAGRPV
jgi:hypothetical protein